MQEGAVLEEVDIELKANGQDGRFIEEVFTRTDTSDFVGLVRCTAEGEFAGVAVELDAGAGHLHHAAGGAGASDDFPGIDGGVSWETYCHSNVRSRSPKGADSLGPRIMKRRRGRGNTSWARGGSWRGLLGALATIVLLVGTIRAQQPLTGTGGRFTRQAAAMRQSHGVDGTGVGIGVLSTGVARLVSGEAAVELLDRVMVLPGQAGEGDEGTETLSVLHQLAPGSDLYFATGLGGPRRFAANIQALCQAGADIIVDDLFDYRETIYPGGRMAQGIQAAVAEGCVYVSAAGKPIEFGDRERQYTPDRAPAPLDDFSTTEDPKGSMSDLSSATCLIAANPDLETFCGNSASPRQVAALAALIIEEAGGAHNVFPEALRAAVAGGELWMEPQAERLAVATGPAIRKIRIRSDPPQGRESYGIGDLIEVEITFSEAVNVTGTPQLGLRVGRVTRVAGYSEGAGTPVLTFSYTVAGGDEDSDGLSVKTDSLWLNNGMIEDSSDNHAELTHPGLPHQLGHRVDAVTPSLLDSDAAAVSGSKLTLSYDELLDGSSTPSAGDFRVMVSGEERGVTTVAVTGNAVTLALASSVVQGEAVTASYAKPAPGTARPIRDPAGNESMAFTNRAVTNRTGEETKPAAGQLSAKTVRQIQSLLSAKVRRTPAQRKVSSRLLEAQRTPPQQKLNPQLQDALRAPLQKPTAAGISRLQTTDPDAKNERVMVDIRADVTSAVLTRIRELGGTVINSVPKYQAIRAQIPLRAVVRLAALDEIRTIRPADEARTRGQAARPSPASRTRTADFPVTKKDDTTEGDVAHRAKSARSTHNVDGTGIGIGVVSDGIWLLADRQASGDVPARVAVLPGQEGIGAEGTALLEIVHDLAPGAELYFATGLGGEARMAENIEALCEAGANVIVDDIGYSTEAFFQDGIIAKGVNAAVADGCFFFSAGGNDGNLTNGTSSVWEGDYAAGSTLAVDGETVGARHDFGGGLEANALSGSGDGAIVLQWADPLGASTNDYDLFVINEDGDVIESSTNTQDGTQDPIEFIPYVHLSGRSVVVVRVSGVDRYLRVQAFGGRLATATAGNTYGHPAAENAIGVAMVDVRDAAGPGDVFNGNESVRRENSDGPRRIFFQPDGTAITAGNFSSTGGQLLQKPDLAAATCVTTATPGFSTFCGTSSAAPHAAAIAALMLEAAGGPNQVTLAELRTGMTTGTAVLDIEATGVDRDSGAGIVMAPGAVDAVDVAVADRNGAPTVENAESDRTLAPGDNAVDIDLEEVFDDPDDDTLTYEAMSSDPDRLTLTRSNAQVTMTPGPPGRAVVRLRAIDPDGLSAVDSVSVTITAGSRDYDTDDDGLIEVGNLAQLDALRYDLNGDGQVDGATWMPYYTAYPMGALGMGCPPTYGCIGYELTANLDFDTDGDGDIDSDDTYWNEGKGWLPIGNADDPFIVRFYGNGHSLTNLFINRPDEDEIGLFGQLGPIPALFSVEATDLGFDILDVGLIGVDISGRDKVGSLVGRADGSETRGSHASGRVAGRDRVGGLVGDSESGVWQSYAAVKVSGRNSVGGLIGSQSTTKILNFISHSRIGVCYATGDVSGANAVGGLVGSSGVSIRAAYATGNVSGTGSRQMGASECELGGGGVGGLVGNACYPKRFGGHIFASYAMGMVSGSVGVGGLVGTTHSEVLFWNNYWDMEASGVRVGVGEDDSNENGVIDGTESHSIGLAGRTTAVLQAPTDYEGIYETWNLDITLDGEPDTPWHFGTSSQYPVLTADLNENGSATWQEFGYQVRDGLTLTAAATEGQAQVVLAWTQVSTSSWSPAPDVTYTLARDDGTTEEAVEKGTTALRYTDTDVTTGNTYTYRVTALVEGGEAIRSAPVSVIAGEGNQPPVAVGILEDLFLRVGAGTGTVALSEAFRDPESDTLTYGASSSETAVATVTSSAAQLTITPVAGGRTAITVTATDAAGSNNSATQRFTVTVWPANAVDYDTDDDNLIEIGNLAQLDAVRHDLDGDGTPTGRGKTSYDTAFENALERMGCSLSVGCRGYELTADLEFDTNGNGAADAADEYWNGGAGWVPIGGAGTTLDAGLYDLENPFTAIFEGNGHTVSHLFIETDTILLVGLFGFAGSSSNIRNLGLIDADVSGPEVAAGLVGLNRSRIRGSYVTGRVSGIYNVGGLVGINDDFAEIRGSYATSHVSGDDDVGGLVGDNRGEIVASYATGRAVGNTDVGGLIGNHKSTGEISAGYATGTVSGGSNAGGLIGLFEGGSINASYWDKQTSGHATGGLPFGRTTAQLQSPRSYSGIYGSWNLDVNGDSVNDDPWDFGTSSQYPALRADRNGDGDATWEEFGYQLRSGPTLTATPTTNAGQSQVELEWTEVPLSSAWTPAPSLSYTVTRDDGAILETIAGNLTVREYTDTDVAGQTYVYQVAAVVNGGEAVRSATVSVTVVGNSPPEPVGTLPDRTLRVGDSAMTEVSGAFRDPEGDTITYGVSSSDPTIASVTVSGTRVTMVSVGAGEATITVTATDESGSNKSRTQRFTLTVLPTTTTDYDADDDGLIEISNLAQLDAVRLDLTGDGFSYATAYFEAFTDGGGGSLACGGLLGCVGYELLANLDFDTDGDGTVDSDDDYWNNGAGWMPIKTPTIGSITPYSAIFEGNGHTITNLFIDSSENDVGLFGETTSSAVIRNLELVAVQVKPGGLVGSVQRMTGTDWRRRRPGRVQRRRRQRMFRHGKGDWRRRCRRPDRVQPE